MAPGKHPRLGAVGCNCQPYGGDEQGSRGTGPLFAGSSV